MGDDDLPPDPFPGDPFADSDASEATGTSRGHDSTGNPLGSSGPFGTMGSMASMFGPLGAMFQQLGQSLATPSTGMAWDAARQTAIWTAAGGQVEDNVDPLERIRYEQTVARATPLVEDATGLTVGVSPAAVLTLTRAMWAAQALEDFRPFFDAAANALRSATPSSEGLDELARRELGMDELGAEGVGEAIQSLFGLVTPMLVATQAGGLVGQLARVCFATFDVPIPRAADRLTFVPTNIAEFAREWSLDIETTRTQLVVIDLVLHAVLRTPTMRDRLGSLLDRHAAASQIDVQAIGQRLSKLAEPDALANLDPDSLFGDGVGAQNAQQKALTEELRVVLAPLVGYVEFHASVLGARLIGDNRQVMEAWKRRRISGGAVADAARSLGLPLDSELYERGSEFTGGVIQRGGPSSLNALWTGPENLPTRNELVAPGLWLARLGLD